MSLFERARQPMFQDKMLPRLLGPVLANLLYRLQAISMSFHTMKLIVRELQQVFLELLAFLDFKEIYRHGRRETVVVHHLMGAFTTSQLVCQGMLDAGLPVWLIRPYDTLHSICIQDMVSMKQPRDFFPVDASIRPSYPTIFEGKEDDISKYFAISKQVVNLWAFPNPFVSTRA